MSGIEKVMKQVENTIQMKIDESDYLLRQFKRIELEILDLKETKAELEAIRSKQC